MSSIEVSVIIPCYNRWSFLPEVISSIVSQTFNNWEIILVDDASDSSWAKLEANERTKYFRLSKRCGSGHARNFGVEQAKGRFILFVDDDVVLSPTYIASVLKIFYDHDDAGAVGGRLFYVKEGSFEQNETLFDTPVRLGEFSGEVLGNFDRRTQGIVEVPVLHVVSLLKKEDFLALGGFDERTYVGNRYREETDLFMRMRKAGKKILYSPTARAYHFAISFGGQRAPLLKSEYFVLVNHARFLSKYYSSKWSLMFISFIFRRFYDRTNQLFNKTNKFLHPERWRKYSERMETQVSKG
jgi:GT2 family glycosyltransferase